MSSLGSTQTGGAVVQQTNPQASLAAGNLGASAASLASQQYQSGVNSALQALNQQYASATNALAPTTVSGVQALDTLNQYLGLSPYLPTAPTNPANWTPTQSDIQNYITQNSHVGTEGQDNQAYTVYTGVGSTPTVGAQQYLGGPASEQDLIGKNGGIDYTPTTGGNFSLGLSSGQTQDITNLLEQQYQQQNNASYQQNLANYNAEKSAYDKATAAGPMTAADINATITNQPGYQAEQAAGINAIQNSASAKGLLGSGSMLKDLMNFGQDMESQYYNSYLGNLAGEANAGNSANSQLASLATNNGNALANLLTSLGTNQANSTLTGANSLANALLQANQTYSTVGQQSNTDLSGIGSLIGGIGSLASGK